MNTLDKWAFGLMCDYDPTQPRDERGRFTFSSGSGKIKEPKKLKLPDILIGKSLGAKSLNFNIMDLQTRKMYKLLENTHLQDVEVFAGKGVRSEYRNAKKYAQDIGGKAEDWQHVKAIGIIDFNGEPRKAEIHWSQCEGYGRHDPFIKRWLE